MKNAQIYMNGVQIQKATGTSLLPRRSLWQKIKDKINFYRGRSRNAGKRTGRRLGGYERRGRIKNVLKKNGYLLSLCGAILQIKRKKVPFLLKKNDYKGMRITCETKDTLPLSALTETTRTIDGSE